MSAFVRRFQNQLLGFGVLVLLLIAGSVQIDGFTSSFNLKSMLVLGSFLGIAAAGQTLCALIGGLDISIPFVIGAANVLLVWLIGKGASAAVAILVVLALATLVGVANGLISYKVDAPPLIVTLGMGFAVIGATQIVAASGPSTFASYSPPPAWLIDMTSLNSSFLGTGIPTVTIVWLAISVGILGFLRFTRFGRGIYALGSNSLAARLALVKEAGIWIAVFTLSGFLAGAAGILLVGFSGGGAVSIGDPYMFTTIAAVVIGGTSLLGGKGGYGLTMLGVAILTVLQSFLVGIGFSPPAQQAMLGALIVVALAFYGREAHPRMRI
ncbi:MAG: ABC transporter permease [Thermoleophilia bacterium]|nr:ABC transporter permease [Thermoleophilia bacterium]